MTEIANKRVYVVTVEGYDGDPQFDSLFFTEEAAKEYVSKKKRQRDYDIQAFEETDNGASKEVW